MYQTLKKENIFWHEVGHYCAQQLNKIHYGKFGCQEIMITKVIQEDGVTRYRGEAIQNKPPDYDPDSKKIAHPASLIGSSVYGCIFQSSFLSESFADCFESERNRANGYCDYASVWDVASSFLFSKEEKEELNNLILHQFEIANKHLNEMAIFDTHIVNFIEKDEVITRIASHDLDQKFKDFLLLHDNIYKTFVDKIEALFKNKKQFIFKPVNVSNKLSSNRDGK